MAFKVAIKFPSSSKESPAKKLKRAKKSPSLSTAKKPRSVRGPNSKSGAPQSSTPRKVAKRKYIKRAKEEPVKIPASFDLTRQVRVVLERLCDSEGHLVRPQHTSEDDRGVTTQIPAEILENFGIATPIPSSPKTASTPLKIFPKSVPNFNCNVGITPLRDPLDTTSSAPQPTSSSSPLNSFESSMDLPNHLANGIEGLTSPDSQTSTPRPEPQYLPSTTVSSSNEGLPSFSPLLSNQCISADECITSNCDLSFALTERLFSMPPTVVYENMCYGKHSIRQLAPYALRVDLGVDNFFQYAAVRSIVGSKYHCVVFGQVDQYLVAFAGHFRLGKENLYDPVRKTVVAGDVKITSLDKLRPHLSLYGVPNKKLLSFPGYFMETKDPEVREELVGSVDGLLAAIDQLRLREQLVTEAVMKSHSCAFSDDNISSLDNAAGVFYEFQSQQKRKPIQASVPRKKKRFD